MGVSSSYLLFFDDVFLDDRYSFLGFSRPSTGGRRNEEGLRSTDVDYLSWIKRRSKIYLSSCIKSGKVGFQIYY